MRNNKFVLNISIIALITVLMCGIASADELSMPGFTMAGFHPVSTAEADAYYQQRQAEIDASMPMQMESMMSLPSIASSGDAEIDELARALKYDPDLIYKFVYDNIAYEPTFGDVKGAYMTLMDRSGNAFDQSSLLIALLRQAGYTANFVHGKIGIYYSAANWLSVPVDILVIANLFAFGGIPFDIVGDLLVIDHMWVQVNIDGVDYMFDPSYKDHTINSAIDLPTAMGYDRNTFLNSCTTGATITSDSVTGLNSTNLANDLSTYTNNLIDHIKTNNPNDSLSSIVGGYKINEIALTDVPRQTELDYQHSITTVYTDMPEIFKTKLTLNISSLSETFDSSEIYGRRLTIFYAENGSNVYPVLYFEGVPVAQALSADAVSIGTSQTLDLIVDHPFAGDSGAYADETVQKTIAAGGQYAIVNGWGNTGTKIISKHREALSEYRHADSASDSEELLGESLMITALSYLAQSSRCDQLSGKITGNLSVNHHLLGVFGQQTGPYIDLNAFSGRTNFSTNNSYRKASMFSDTGRSSAFEHGVIEQLNPFPAISTVKLLDLSVSQGDTIFKITNDNYTSVINETNLGEYDLSYRDYLTASFDAAVIAGDDLTIFISETAELGEGAPGDGSWRGTVNINFRDDGSSIALGYSIGGDYNGGYASDPDAYVDPYYYNDYAIVDPSDWDWGSNPMSFDPIDLVTGKFTYDSTDLTVGSGAFPDGLGLSRSYNSGSALNDGPMGLGWNHNFEIKAEESSDGFQAMGADSPIDAAANIVQLFIANDLLTADYTDLVNVMVSTMSQKWIMDQMTDNVVTVNQPGSSMRFVKLPDGSYNPPQGNASKLTKDGDGSYMLTAKNGTELDFDTEGFISTWKDITGNTVTFNYDTILERTKEIVHNRNPYNSPTDGLVAHWAFEGSGSTAIDSSDTGAYSGQMLGGVVRTADGEGISGKAVEFTDHDDYIDMGYHSELDPTTFTLVAWVKMDTLEADLYHGGIGLSTELDDWYSLSNPNSYKMYYYGSNAVAKVKIILGSGASSTTLASGSIPDQVWNMSVMTFADHYDGVVGNVTLYNWNLSSGLILEETSNLWAGGWEKAYANSTKHFAIGSNEWVSDPFYPYTDYPTNFDGLVDEVRFYNRVLSGTELNELFLYDAHPDEWTETEDIYTKRLTGVSNDFGNSLTFSYTGDTIDDHVETVTDETGRDVSYGYDLAGKGNLEKFTDAMGEITTYEYGSGVDGQISKIFDPRLNPGGTTVKPSVVNVYNPLGQVVQQTNPHGFVYDYYFATGRRAEEVGPARASGAIAHWQMAEITSSNEVTDRLGIADGTIYGSPLCVFGKVGKALYFDGVSAKVDIADSEALTVSDKLTVACWIKRDRLVTREGIAAHFDAGNNGWLLDITDDNKLLINLGNGTSNMIVSNLTIADDQWHHIAVTADLASSEVTFYVDSSLPDTIMAPGTLTSIGNPARDMVIASETPETPGGSYYFNGCIDDLMLFDRALTADEIKVMYDSSGSSLIYEFNDSGKTTKVIGRAGNATSTEYDGHQRKTSITSPLGSKSVFQYDSNHNMILTYTMPVEDQDPDSEWMTEGWAGSGSWAPAQWQPHITTSVYDPTEDAYNHLLSTTDRLGNTTTYDYYDGTDGGPNGLLKSVTVPGVPDVLITTNTYYMPADTEDPSYGLLDTVTSPEGIVTKYEYTFTAGHKMMTSTVTSDYCDQIATGCTHTPAHLNAQTITEYDTFDDDDPDTPMDMVGNIVSVTDVKDNITRFTDYDAMRRPLKVIDPSGVVTKTDYYADGKVKKVQKGDGLASSAVAIWKLDEGQGDAVGNLLSNENPGTISYCSWVSGKYSKALSFDGVSSYVTFDGFKGIAGTQSRTVSAWIKTDSLGTIVSWGEIIESKKWKFKVQDDQGIAGVIRLEVGGGYVEGTTNVQDSEWHHVAVVYDNSISTDVADVKLYLDGDREVISDSSSQLINTASYADVEIGAYTTNPSTWGCFSGDIDEVMIFDRALQDSEIQTLSVSTISDLIVTEYTYTKSGKKENVRGSNYTAANNRQTSYQYDSLDRLYELTDAMGNPTKTLYYPDGKVWKTIDAEGNVPATYTYTANGSVETILDASEIEIAPGVTGNPTLYLYDGYGRSKKTYYADTTFEKIVYDIYGRVDYTTNRSDQTIDIVYDTPLGRIASKTVNGAAPINYSYDEYNRQSDVVDASYGTIGYDYDRLGRLDTVTYPGDKLVSYTYDIAGNRDSLTYPDGSSIKYAYDNLNRLTDIYDSDDLVDPIVTYGYDVLSRRTSATYENGQTTTYTYGNATDATAGRLTSLTTAGIVYDYDNAGHTNYDAVGNLLNFTVDAQQHTYTYDNIYQLKIANYPDTFDDTTFNYDAVGNRDDILEDTTPIDYTPNNLNQYSSVDGVTYNYDTRGNLEDVTGDGTPEYAYDAENHMTTASVNGNSAVYTYDPFGRRASKNVDGSITTYLYDGDQVICEYNTGGDIVRKFVYGTGVDEPVRMTAVLSADLDNDGDVGLPDLVLLCQNWLMDDSDSDFNPLANFKEDDTGPEIINNSDIDTLADHFTTTGDTGITRHFYYHFNQLGSVIALTDKDGDVVETYKYNAFGKPQITDSTLAVVVVSKIGNPYMFTARRYDPETKLYYYRARMYNPYIGRFMQTDPIGYSDGMGWYSYCVNNPLFFIDPFGLCGERSTWGNVWRAGLMGDFAEDTGWSGVGTQVVVGLIPYVGQAADARDTIAAIKNLWQEPSWGNAGNLGLAGLAWVPLLGDGIKGATKAGREIASEGAQAVAKNVDELSQAAAKASKNNLTEAGRNLQKKASRPGTVYSLDGATKAHDINRVGQDVVDDILTTPGATFKTMPDGSLKVYALMEGNLNIMQMGVFTVLENLTNR